jgi:hypothetical protein
MRLRIKLGDWNKTAKAILLLTHKGHVIQELQRGMASTRGILL